MTARRQDVRLESERYRQEMAILFGLYQKLGYDLTELHMNKDALVFKSRTFNDTGWSWSSRNSGVAQWATSRNRLISRESVWSYDSPFYYWLGRKGKARIIPGDPISNWKWNYANSRAIGGAFLMIREGAESLERSVVHANTYRGPIGIYDVAASSPTKPPPISGGITDVSVLNALGATAMSRVIPTNPKTNLSTFIGELREGLPSAALLSIYRDRTRNLMQNSGGEYLNYTFGWAPMIDDLRNMAKAIRNSEWIFKQYLKDAGKRVRRSYQFPVQKTVQTIPNVTFTTGSSNSAYALMNGECEIEEEIHTWFSGSFRYYIPEEANNFLGELERYSAFADRLLGVDLTPEVLWNLLPWTWMLDWIGNFGDVMTNISNLGHDDVTMQYGYIMEHRKVTHTYTAYFNGQRMRTQKFFESKRRHPASPYGFGLSWDGLTVKQQAILVALGVSRV